MHRFLFTHRDDERAIVAVYEVPADAHSYRWWRRRLRDGLCAGETLEFSPLPVAS